MLSSSARASAGSSTGVYSDVTTCRGPRTEPAGLTGTTWPGHQPVKQMADRGEPLLDARHGELARRRLDPSGDVHRLHGGDRRQAGARAPGQEFVGGPVIGPPRVWVADVGREEFEEAHRGALAGRRDKRRPCGRADRTSLFMGGPFPARSRASHKVSRRRRSRRSRKSRELMHSLPERRGESG